MLSSSTTTICNTTFGSRGDGEEHELQTGWAYHWTFDPSPRNLDHESRQSIDPGATGVEKLVPGLVLREGPFRLRASLQFLDPRYVIYDPFS